MGERFRLSLSFVLIGFKYGEFVRFLVVLGLVEMDVGGGGVF